MLDRNPFPGMNPWIERLWQTVHHTYVYECLKQISGQLPVGLFCEAEETVYVVEAEWSSAEYCPDIGVFVSPGVGTRAAPGAQHGSGTGVATPVKWRMPVESAPQMHIAIRSIGGDEPLVTTVEIITPTNKLRSRPRRQYLRNRRAYFDAGANVVEVDLLRRGNAIVGPESADLPASLQPAYRANVSPTINSEVVQPEGEYYPLPLRERLPRISIPLRVGDEDIVLDLQQPVDTAYKVGRYGMRIDYSKPPNPPLSPEDAEWAAEVIAGARGSLSPDGSR